ncbi:50S ribosomal protein L29 [Candidatus Parcubacteria bacterium]|jgi:large subunit ribosomal protein L29|nr:50S ribosomal protein L29 [Candidatus Parcubacteria bacterium]MBT7228721.1 50S ribosomal protein L29 [Candidatus Parcubacteria bacterium]
MKIQEIKKLEMDKLHEKLAELRNKSRELRFSIANNQLKKVRDLRDVKKDIAKILTILNEKRIAKESKTNKVEDK